MAYSDFTFVKLKQKFDIQQRGISLFKKEKIDLITPSEGLQKYIDKGRAMPLQSEKAKSEALIFPIIRELKDLNENISIFSGYPFNIDSNSELNGAPDFMISAQPEIVEPQSPIFCLVEKKNKTPEDGFAQCAAEMYAARLFNQQNNDPHEIIYGAVTNGYDWVFLKLEANFVFVDTDRYFINELPKLLGILQFIIDQTVYVK